MYKYLTPNSKSIISILQDRKLWFSTPDSFNDPFECKPHFAKPREDQIEGFLVAGGTLKSVLKRRARELKKTITKDSDEIESNVIDYISKWRILCLTKKNDNMLMWSHYSQDHKGVCFHFDENIVNSGVLGVTRDVSYDIDYPRINFLDYYAMVEYLKSGSKYSVFQEEITERVERSVVFSKSKDWEYEEEVRCVRTPKIGGVEPLYHFPKEMLKGVILGARVEKDTIERVQYLVDSYPADIYVKRAKVSKNRYKLIIS